MMQITLALLIFAAPVMAITPTVQHDPFKKPDFLQPAAAKPVDNNKAVNSDLSHLKLTAILQAGKNSMVILQGKTLQRGETFEGYRLIEINERSAVFRKDKKTFIFTIDETNENN